MHEMQTIVTDVCGLLSVSLSVILSLCGVIRCSLCQITLVACWSKDDYLLDSKRSVLDIRAEYQRVSRQDGHAARGHHQRDARYCFGPHFVGGQSVVDMVADRLT